MITLPTPILLFTALFLVAMRTAAQTENPIQSKARPFGLEIVVPVMSAGSDKTSAVFQQSSLPDITSYLNQTLGESNPFDSSAFLLDPSKLLLRTEADVRVYFIGEGTGYRNTLGFNTSYGSDSDVKSLTGFMENAVASDKASDNNKDKEKVKDNYGAREPVPIPYEVSKDGYLIFPDASSPISIYDPSSKAVRTETAPLLPGDFVDLGRFSSGTLLDFFLIANGADDGTTTYSTQSSLNPDGIDHVVAFAYGLKDSPYLLLGFEDLYGGGDKDFNDVLFAIDIGKVNIASLTATPEPSTVLILVGLITFGIVLKRRKDRPTS